MSKSKDRLWALGSAALAASAFVGVTTAFAGMPSSPPDDLALVEVTNIGASAVAVRHAGDGSNRIFIVQQTGIVWIYDLDAGQLLSTPFLDIESEVDDGGNEQGLLGIAFDPDYPNNGYFYVNYTYDPGAGLDRTRIERYTVSTGNPNVADATSAVSIIEIEQDFSNHNAGDLAFGPDGYLYIPLGDGGGGGDPEERAQDPAQLLGKILRIEPTGVVPPPSRQQRGAIGRCGLVGAYEVPASNPYVSDDSVCDETWAFGLRNPFRFSFDRLTGDMLIGDVGQSAREEVNFQPVASTGGENYGWDCREGELFFENNDFCDELTLSDFTEPVISYGRGGGQCSVIGGYVYRGNIRMAGVYWFTDFCSGDLRWATEAGGWVVNDAPFGTSFAQGFGEDEAGELYVAESSGRILRFTSAVLGIFSDDFEIGDTGNWSSTMP